MSPAARTPLLACALAVAGCMTSPGGPSYVGVSVTGVDDQGVARETECVELPVLLGSRVETTYQIEDLDVVVLASRDEVEVTFRGAANASALRRVVSAEALRGGYHEVLEADVGGGRSFEVHVDAPCRDSTPAE